MPPPVVVIVGGGLAGLSAAHEASQALLAAGGGGRVVLLEKNAQLGGNSAKASSGINAVTADQGDSVAAFAADTRQSGGGFSDPGLVEVLAGHSVESLRFLEGLGLDLGSVVRLGGHSFPRTHANPTGPNVGFALISAVASKVKAAANVEVITHAKVLELHAMPDGRLSVMYAAAAGQQPTAAAAAAAAASGGGARLPAPPAQPQLEDPPLPAVLLADALVLATGGFAASKELLQKYGSADAGSEEAAQLPTTNGPWATGDGIRLGESLGAALVGMQHIQVHPTGFVDPADPAAGTKWLAPEKLRGCGALLLNACGQRFVDELATRDVVAAALMQQEGRTAWLLLGAAGAAVFGEGTLVFYGSKGLVTRVDNLAAAAAHMGVPAATLQQQLDTYNAIAAPAAAPAAAAAGNAAGTSSSSGDAFGKRFFPGGAVGPDGPLWLSKVTPVVHYCMGGLRINTRGEVLREDGSPIRGLWAAGEVSGGLHGANRLGGNSLAECVALGRIAGSAAAARAVQQQAAAAGSSGGARQAEAAAVAAAL